MGWFLSLFKKSGDKEWCHLTTDTDRELERASKVLNAPIHGKGRQQPHLDLNRKQATRAEKRGATRSIA